MHGTKIEAIVAGLEEHLGLVIIEHGAKYEVVKKSRNNCKHRDTDHTRLCTEPCSVTCPEWRYDHGGITEQLVRCNHVGEDLQCMNCYHSSPHVELNGCASAVYDYCKYIDGNIKCVPIKGDK